MIQDLKQLLYRNLPTLLLLGIASLIYLINSSSSTQVLASIGNCTTNPPPGSCEWQCSWDRYDVLCGDPSYVDNGKCPQHICETGSACQTQDGSTLNCGTDICNNFQKGYVCTPGTYTPTPPPYVQGTYIIPTFTPVPYFQGAYITPTPIYSQSTYLPGYTQSAYYGQSGYTTYSQSGYYSQSSYPSCIGYTGPWWCGASTGNPECACGGSYYTCINGSNTPCVCYTCLPYSQSSYGGGGGYSEGSYYGEGSYYSESTYYSQPTYKSFIRTQGGDVHSNQ